MTIDWVPVLHNQAFAYEGPCIEGKIKVDPEDFVVEEVMGFDCTDQGEHFWLWVEKINRSTDDVARQLAKHAKVAFRDVGYAGMKDVRAVTRQWFSVWCPHTQHLDWSGFSHDGIRILKAIKHNKKLKRGVHRSNRFEIRIQATKIDSLKLSNRLNDIKRCGVPNYFGMQRFGHQARNINAGLKMLLGDIKVKQRSLRSIYLSALRSFLFNQVLSERVKEGSWLTAQPCEPLMLDGSNSLFNADGSPQEAERLQRQDIHPSGPMWGSSTVPPSYTELHDKEVQWLSGYDPLLRGLEQAGLKYQRRALRSRVDSLEYDLNGNHVMLRFELARGQFATSVLRELLRDCQ